MKDIDWDIVYTTKGKRYRLQMMAECEVVKSVDNLVDEATIVLPATVLNAPLSFDGKVERGSEVVIQMGYDGELRDQFHGFVREITTNDSSLKVLCEDALFLFRKSVPDTEMKPTDVKAIARYLVQNIEPDYKVDCTYSVGYEKFTIHEATGYDVLKKLQDDTAANIFFDTASKTLHIHPPYVERGQKVFYSMQKNIEQSSLEYKNKLDKKVEVVVESTDLNGNVHKVKSGTTGGDKVTFKVGAMSEDQMKKIADARLVRENASGYEGSFDGWLVPFVQPGDSVRIKDEDYADKTSYYYAKSVTVNLSKGGGVVTVKPGIKLTP